MFGIKKKNTENTLTTFLDTVDSEYMKAYTTRSIQILQKYVSRECALKISRVIGAYNSRYFGTERFRKTTWTILDNICDRLTIKKSVEFSKVKISGTVKMSVADNYEEIWIVDYSDKNRPFVLDIKAA